MLAYALDEAACGTTRAIDVIVHSDGSVSVADDGRGTDTRQDDRGVWRVKPVMATADLRFFDVPGAPVLTDGLPRAGMSVVTALSEWLVHTNVRDDTAWSARYEWGLPAGPPEPVEAGRTTGTTVRFMPDTGLLGGPLDVVALGAAIAAVGSPAAIHLAGA